MSIVFILDESLSMQVFKSSYMEAINLIISNQKIQNPRVKFSLLTFSENLKVICLDADLNTLPEFSSKYYHPNGCTGLYDAIGNSIKLKENDPLVIMIILSDGEENCSKIFNLHDIKTKIQQKSDLNWQFIYIATNQDTNKVGLSMGIFTCINYSESVRSISKVVDSCNIAISHCIYKLTGIPNQFINIPIPLDVSDILNSFENIKI